MEQLEQEQQFTYDIQYDEKTGKNSIVEYLNGNINKNVPVKCLNDCDAGRAFFKKICKNTEDTNLIFYILSHTKQTPQMILFVIDSKPNLDIDNFLNVLLLLHYKPIRDILEIEKLSKEYNLNLPYTKNNIIKSLRKLARRTDLINEISFSANS